MVIHTVQLVEMMNKNREVIKRTEFVMQNDFGGFDEVFVKFSKGSIDIGYKPVKRLRFPRDGKTLVYFGG